MAKYVPTHFRKHPLSFMPGGCIVIVTMMNNESFIYDKIKYPLSYITAIIDGNKSVATIYLNNAVVWSINDQQPQPRKLVSLSVYKKAA